MKKLFILLLTLGLVFSIVGNTYGNVVEDTQYKKISTFVRSTVNLGYGMMSTADKNGWYCPTATITTNDRILGFTVTANTATKGAVASLYDLSTAVTDNVAAEAQMTDDNLIVELETGADPGSATLWFPYPLKIAVQLGILTGQAPVTVTVYYIDVSEQN